MKKVTLGLNGPKVSVIGLGGMSFSDFYGKTTEKNTHNILDKAIDYRINLIDTANIYGLGQSEVSIGNYFKKKPSSKSKFIICTKASIEIRKDIRRINNSYSHLEKEIDKSLKKLNVPVIDLFYIHRKDPNVSIEIIMESLLKLIKKGKIKYIGFSEIAPSSLISAHKIFPVSAIQSEYSLATRIAELGLLQTAKRLGISFVAFSPLSRGLLTDNPPSTTKVKDIPFLKEIPRFQGNNLLKNLEIVKNFRLFCQNKGHSCSSVALAWILKKNKNVIVIPGTRSTLHLEQLYKASKNIINNSDIKTIEKILPPAWAYGDRYSERQWIGPERYC